MTPLDTLPAQGLRAPWMTEDDWRDFLGTKRSQGVDLGLDGIVVGDAAVSLALMFFYSGTVIGWKFEMGRA